MRPISILTAIAVCVALYLVVFQRDEIMALDDGGGPGMSAAETSDPVSPGAAEASADPGDPAPGADAEPETGSEPGSETETETVISVVAMRSQGRAVDSAVILRGRTEAVRQIEVRAETSGLVMSEPLQKGREVETGDLLCRLDPGTRDAALNEARSRLEEARARLTDAEINSSAAARLSQDGFASETRVTSANAGVESARAAVRSAEAAIAGAEKEIERLEIRAPFGGLLEDNSAELGALLQPGAPCATIIQLDPILMVGFAPETQVDRITEGAPVTVRLASGRMAEGEVSFISRAADPATRTFRVEARVENGDMTIRDGQTAEIMIGSEGAEAHLLPQSALTLSNDGDLGVRLVDAAQTVKFATVAVLRDTPDGVWVTGLDTDVSVIVVGQEFVTEGVAVKPTFRDGTQ